MSKKQDPKSQPKSLKGQAQSLDRDVRQLRKALGEVQGSLDGMGGAADQAEAKEVLAINVEFLKGEIDTVDTALRTFDDCYVQAEGLSDLEGSHFKAQIELWGDALYEGKRKVAESTRYLRPTPPPPPSAPGGQPPPNPDQASTSTGGGGIMDQMARVLTLLEARQSSPSQPPSQPPAQQSAGSSSGSSPDPPQFTRLPKLELPKFEGDILKWRPFWDRFEASVDKNPKLADVDKLNYLISMLANEPLMLVQTLPLTHDNYPEAKSILQKKYGNKKMVVALLYRKFTELKPVSNDPLSLRKFVAEIDCLLGSLGTFGQDTSDDHFATIILSKLPSSVFVMLEMAKEVEEDWTVALVRSKLTDYLVRLERASQLSAVGHGGIKKGPIDFTSDGLFGGERPPKSGPPKGKKGTGQGGGSGGHQGGSKGKERGPPTGKDRNGSKGQGQSSVGGQGGGAKSQQPHCVFCNGSHYSDQCSKFPTADDRFKRVGDRCRICFNPNHHKKDCRSQKPCFYCGVTGSHHSSLCFKKFGKNSDSDSANLANDPPPSSSPGSPDPNHESDSSLLASGEGVVMQTAKIPVKAGPQDSQAFVVARSVFDPGCNRTYATQHLAKKVGMRTRRGPSLKVNRFGSDDPVTVPTRVGFLRLRKLDGSLASVEVSVIPKITGDLVRAPVNSPNLDKLKTRVTLADDIPTKFEHSSIDLLIGNDYYLDFITADKITVDRGLYLLGSEFGYILSGRTPLPRHGGYTMAMCGLTCGTLEGLEDLVAVPKTDDRLFKKPVISDLWTLEGLGIRDKPEVSSDDLAVHNFKENVQFKDGRYHVSLPKTDKFPDLNSNYKLSAGRLDSVVRRIKPNPELFETYNGIIQDQLAKGVIEKVDPKIPVSKSHYIPHHAVITPHKETTKVRIVYDGSARVRKDSPSLNDCLHRGPVLLEDLAGLLMRFRTHKYGVIADIEKAFLQIGILPEDRDMLRFLWLKDPSLKSSDNNIQIFRFCRVLFGLNCSPALLLQTVNHHLQSVGSKVADQVRQNLYADNVITGVDSLEEGIGFYQEAKSIFQQASMNLRQWTTNLPGLMDHIPPEDRMRSSSPKVLGLEWDRESDLLIVTVNPKLKSPARTKRELLSQLSTVFDPLGFYTPVTISGKVILQKICESKPDWDAPLSACVVKDWEDQRSKLLEIPLMPLPRPVPFTPTSTLVAFCDASTRSFATVVYLCSNGFAPNLLMSKSRLNPIKQLTIPRLELMGILIGVRAINFVAVQLGLPKSKGVVLSDSSCALQWLKAQDKQNVFVRNRVKEIANKSKWLKFRYVHTDENPADWATRGKRAPDLTDFWWKGPDWLPQPVAQWPHWDFPEIMACETLSPPNPLHEASLVATPAPDPVLGIDLSRFSSHLKLVRVTAWCLRFIDRLKGRGEESSCLTAVELLRAQSEWETYVQHLTYSSVLKDLNTNQERQMGQLRVFKDGSGVLRCKARFENSDIAWETKYPILLPKSHPYTRLLIRRIHCLNGHPSVTHTLTLVNKKFWIPKGRQLVKSIIHRCVTCKKAAGRPYARPDMPELPANRLVPQPCFTTTGVDYFGPVKLRGQVQVDKAWVALFTCLTTRAIHLELVPDLSASEFLLAFRRFIARRGKPSTMLSDNAPQFKTVAKASDIAWDSVLQNSEILDLSAREGISWKFIVEYAPYMGGVYERLVGIVKTCLRKTIGASLLTPTQFETLLCECEAIVNTRPLSYVSSDLADGFVLTPAHFLSLNPRVAIPDMPVRLRQVRDLHRLDTPTLESLVNSWKKGQNLLSEFWKLWKDQYLNALRERMTYRHKHNQGSISVPQVGDIVLLKEAGLPRGAWKISKITKIHQGIDNRIRSATVQLPSGRELHRPINLIIPLEVLPKSASPVPPPNPAHQIHAGELESEAETDED